MQSPDDDVRRAIQKFILEYAHLDPKFVKQRYRGSLNEGALALERQGIPRTEIYERIERSVQIFSEEWERRTDFVPGDLQSDSQVLPLKQSVSVARTRRPMPEEKRELVRAKMAARNEASRAAYQKRLEELGPIRTLSQSDILRTRLQKALQFGTIKSSKIKVLLVCVSHDEDVAEQTASSIVRYLAADFDSEIEFFCVNPDFYGPARDGHRIWIDRDHYFQMPFGTALNPAEFPDYDRLLQNGPYDFVIYDSCALYARSRTELEGVGNDINVEGQQLNAIMKPDSILVMLPFNPPSTLPISASLAFRSVGIDLLGITADSFYRGSYIGGYARDPVGIYMKRT